MTQPDRAAIDAMTKALDAVFGRRTPRYVKGDQIDDIPLGRRGYADDIESLGRAGATPAQMDRLLHEFAQVDPVSAKMILARDRYRHQRAAVTNPQDVAAIRKEFLAKHTRSNEKHGTVGAVESLPNLVAKYGEQSVKDMGYFARQKQILSHPRVIKDALEQSFLGNVRYTGKPTKWGKFKEIGKQVGVVESGVAHNLKLIEELNRVGKVFMDYRFNIRDIRERERGGSALGNATIANMLKSMPTRSSHPYRGQAALTPIKLPTNPLAGIRGLAEQFVKERALSQAGNIGSVISRSNVLKQMSRAANRNTPAITPPPINFPSRGTHPVNLRDRFMSSSIGRYLGSKSDQVKRVGESVGFGLGTGALGYGAFQLANIGSQAIGSFGSEIARMVMGFKSGGSVPRFDSGGDTFNTPLVSSAAYGNIANDAVKRLQLLRIRAQAGNRLKGLRQDAQLNMQMGNTSLFRSPETASGIINSRVLNNLSSIFSGQKGQKFALGGDIPGFKNGTTPFNFRHFNIGRNSKYIKDMYNAASPFRNDSDGQYQMFRAIENKKMGPKDFGLFTALNGMDPVSALSYQSDGSGIEMTDLGTHPAFQGKGLATSLIGKMFDVGQNKGIDTAYWSAKDDASASFYNHLGAKNEGRGAFSFDLNNWKGRFAKGGVTTINLPKFLEKPYDKVSSTIGKLIPRSMKELYTGILNSTGLGSNRYDDVSRIFNETIVQYQSKKFNELYKDQNNRKEMYVRQSLNTYGIDKNSLGYERISNVHSNMPKSWKRAFASQLHKRPLQFKDMNSIDSLWGAALGAYYPTSNRIDLSDYSNNTIMHEMTHSLFESAPEKIKKLAKYRLEKELGIYTTDWTSATQESMFGKIPILNKLSLFRNYFGNTNEMFAYAVGDRGKYANGGGLSSLSNPIRVSDGELAISRGMVDKIGLDTLRKINSGDVSAAFGKGFARGGIFEYDGPGTGTSDSILEDADKGPRGKDASDIGFIIKRSSSDKLKSLLGGGFSKLSGIRGFYGGGNPFGGDIGAFESKLNDVMYDPSTPNNMRKYTGKNVQKVIKLAFANNPAGDAQDIFKAVLTSNFNGSKQGRYLEAVAGNKKDGYANIGDNIDALKGVLEDVFQQQFDIPTMDFSSVTKGSNQFAQALQIATKALDSATQSIEKNDKETKRNTQNTIDDTRRQKEHTDTIKDATGTYRGQLDYVQMRGSRFGETDVTDLVEGGPNNPPTRDELLSQSMGPRNTGGITGWWNRNLAGMGSRFMQQLMSPTAMQYRVQSNIEMPIGAVGYTTEQQRDTLAANRAEYNNQRNDILERFRNEFGDILGDLNIEDLVKVTQGTKMERGQIQTGEEIVPDPKNPEGMPLKVPIMQDITYEVGITEVNATALEDKLRGKMSPDEYTVRAERAMQPSGRARQGLQETVDGKTVDTIKSATVQTSRFHEEIKKVNMTQTGLYKMGDILRGVSWRFASLGMSAMGVYFSIQGLVMTFQQGLGSIITPLSDVEALFKSIGMSTAFGDGIYNASEAMKDMGVNQESLIEGWKNLTNMQGTIQTFFASIGAKVFGDKDFTNNILNKIAEAFEVLGSDKSIETFQNLIKAVVDSLPAIIPAIQSITAMLQWIADNPVLIQWGAQLMMISLIVQPIASGLAAIVTIGGGFFTIANLFATTAGALGEVAIASKTAGMGMAFMASSAARLLVISSGLLIAYELIANTLNMIGVSSAVGGKFGMSNFQLPTLTGMLLPGNQGGYATGGEIGGSRTAAIDDKTINVEEGEFVVKRDVAQKNKDKLKQFNSTGVWPGDEKRSLGGFTLMPSGIYGSGAPLAPFKDDIPAVQKSFESNRIAGLTEVTKDNTGKSSKVLTEVQEGDTLAVTVRNWPNTWGSENGNGNELPFDVGFPSINELIHGTGTMGLVNDIFNRNPSNAVNNQNTNNVNNNFNSNSVVNNNQNINNNNENQNNNENNNQNNNQNEQTNGVLDQVLKAINNLVANNQLDINEIMKGVTTSGTNYQAVNPAFQVGMTTNPNGNRPEFNWNEIFTGVLSSAGSIIDTAVGGISGRVPGYTSPISDPIEYTKRVMYDFGFYNEDGKPYIKEDTPVRTNTYDAFMEGRYVLPSDSSPNVPSQFKGVPMQWHMPGVEHAIMDIPQDTGEIFTGMAESDSNPYRGALDLNSAMTGNAIGAGVVGAAQKVALTSTSPIVANIARAIGIPGTLLMEGAAAVEAFTGVVAGESFDTGNKIRKGEITSSDATRGKYRNKGTGFITGNSGVSLTGKGYEVLQVRSGGVTPTDVQTGLTFANIVKSYMPQDIMGDEQKSKEVDKLLNLIPFSNKQLLDIPLKNPTNNLMYDSFGAADVSSSLFKPLGEVIMNGLKQADTNVDNSFNGAWRQLPVIGGFRSADFVEGTYGAAEALANPNLGNVVDWGALGIGGGALIKDFINNFSKMSSENPMSAPYLGITSTPFVGPFLSPLMMPQTHEWMQQSGNIYQDVMPVGLTPEQTQVTQQSQSNDYSIITSLIDVLKTNNQTQNQQPQTISIPIQITVSGDELATKGYVDVTIEREVPNVIRQNQPRIVGH